MNPWDTQTARIFGADGVYHTLSSREKSGLDRSGVLAFKSGNGERSGGIGLKEELSPTLNAECGGYKAAVLVFSQNGSGDTTVHEKCNAITANQNPSGRGTAMIFGFQPQAGGNTTFGIEQDRAPTLGVTQKPAVYDARGNGDGLVCPTITGDNENRVADFTAVCVGNGQTGNITMSEVGNTLDTMHDAQAVMVRSVVRRLTPLECERLQGYPDGWTDIGEWIDSKGKKRKTSDAARYKALGNSIALPYWRVMLGRLIRYCRAGTMASLFDGIGGFPLCWHSVGGETLWASEIEEFPLEVTRRRFGED